MPLQLRVGAEPRRNRLIKDRNHDCYRLRGKPRASAWCPICGVVFHGGRWQWSAKEADAHQEKCPACLRVQDRMPAGFLRLEGPFFAEHAGEILNCVKNEAEKVNAQHALHRIIEVKHEEGRTLITTTDPHLARGLGEALHHSYKGELDFHYVEEDTVVRVSWRR